MERTLYKLNTSNQISWWNISLDNHKVTIKWGHRLPIEVTENITTDDLLSPEKAEAEFYSRIRKQIDRRGYEETIPTSKPMLPMTCQEYRIKNPPTYSSFALQPKLDGIRCLVSREQIVSRRNRLITSIPHIELYGNHLPENIILDGELIIKNTPLHIIESYVMRQSPDLKVCKEIEFHVFDIVDTEAPFIERIKAVEQIIETMEQRYVGYRQSNMNHPYFSIKFPIKMVQTVIFDESFCPNKTQEYFDEKVSQGHEGIIIRNLDGPYQIDTRSRHILKMKEFFDDEYEIINVVEGKNSQGIFVCRTRDGGSFNCSFKGTHAIRKQQLIDKQFYIGKWLRIEHEGVNEDSNKPRCPIGVHFFNKKDHE